jgi:hypothetical protein
MMMGISQVVTLRLPASRLREVNRSFENTACGSYHTEFYPTCDFKAVGIAAHDRAQQAGGAAYFPVSARRAPEGTCGFALRRHRS